MNPSCRVVSGALDSIAVFQTCHIVVQAGALTCIAHATKTMNPTRSLLNKRAIQAWPYVVEAGAETQPL